MDLGMIMQTILKNGVGMRAIYLIIYLFMCLLLYLDYTI